MPDERIKQDKLCDNCISRLICPLAGRACMGHNSEGTFKGLLKMIVPDINWDGVLLSIKETRESNRGYRNNE